jgi:hypothetical protein
MDDYKIIFISMLIVGIFLRIIIGSLVLTFIYKENINSGKSNIIIWSNFLIIISILTLTSEIIQEKIDRLYYPSIAIIITLLYEIYITYSFYNRINNNNIPNIIYIWDFWTNVIYICITVLSYIIFKEDNSSYLNMIYILVSLAIVISYFKYTIMNYYIVDPKIKK